MSYQLLKSIHLIFAVSWFAGLFYIFRLFVYHVQNWQDAGMRRVFSEMERKLLQYIMLPASTGTLVFGLLLLNSNPDLIHVPWIWMKFGFVLMLYAYHGLAWRVFKRMRLGERLYTERICRALNEVPTLALIGICVLVFLKPQF